VRAGTQVPAMGVNGDPPRTCSNQMGHERHRITKVGICVFLVGASSTKKRSARTVKTLELNETAKITHTRGPVTSYLELR
jgi:hypothetical protein